MKFNNLLYKDLPVYNIVLNDEDENQGLSVVSIVSDPAVCEQLYCFDKEDKKQMIFASEENEQKCITSVAILADVPIYRIDEYGNPYYVVFQKQVIRDLVEKYSKDGYQNLVSFEHNGEIVNDFVLIESYFVDKEKGIAPGKFDVSDGSWIVTYKCTNDETWEKVKNELGTGGYSIEINCEIEPAPADQEILDEPEREDDYDADFDWLAELIKMLEADGDCEIIMSSDKDKWLVNGDGDYWLDEKGNKVPAKCPKCGADVGVYVKGEPVYLCSECGEYLGTVKFPDDEMFSIEVKKKSEYVNEDASEDDNEDDGFWNLNFDEVERADVASQIKKAVKIDGKKYWIYGVGKDNGTDVAIIFDPEKKKYELKPIKDIKEWLPIKEKPGEFPVLPPNILDDPNVAVQKTIITDDISSLLHNRVICQLSYNDDKPQPATGYRQICIVAHGMTKAQSPNECIRAYELFGDSRSEKDGTGEIPDYRMFLTSRIVNLKPMFGTEPWGRDVLDSRYNWSGDRGMSTVFEHITEADFLN